MEGLTGEKGRSNEIDKALLRQHVSNWPLCLMMVAFFSFLVGFGVATFVFDLNPIPVKLVESLTSDSHKSFF